MYTLAGEAVIKLGTGETHLLEGTQCIDASEYFIRIYSEKLLHYIMVIIFMLFSNLFFKTHHTRLSTIGQTHVH